MSPALTSAPSDAFLRARSACARAARLPFVFVSPTLLCILFVAAPPAHAARIPRPVSPGAEVPGAVAETRCPTFSWSGVPGASGYEIAVFRVANESGAEPVLVTRATVAGDARGYTPPLDRCLERGQRYAWSVAAVGGERGRSGADRSSEAAGADRALAWSPAFLFDVEAAPSSDELERALDTLDRYLAAQGASGASSARRRTTPTSAPSSNRAALNPGRHRVEDGIGSSTGDVLPGALIAPTTSGVIREASAATTPAFGSASLTVSDQIHLAAASDLFKNGVVFLWDDLEGNTALGREALASVTGFADRNTAVGRGALRSTTGAGNPLFGSFNTAIGDRALYDNTLGFVNTATGALALSNNSTGYRNTATGAYALQSNTVGSYNTAVGNNALLGNTEGSGNTAIGESALQYTTTGDKNIAIGDSAGSLNSTGSSSIFIGNNGANSDTATIKIGTPGIQTSTFIAGIANAAAPLEAVTVLITPATGKLGISFSSRAFKRDVQDLDALADRLLALHPVAFRYREHVEADPDAPLEFGLIAEEVAEVFPELVVFDQDGKPLTVKYHLLSSLLLGALQQHQASLERQEQLLAAQRGIAAEQRAELDRQAKVAAEQEAELRRLARVVEGRDPVSRRGASR